MSHALRPPYTQHADFVPDLSQLPAISPHLTWTHAASTSNPLQRIGKGRGPKKKISHDPCPPGVGSRFIDS